MALNEQRILKQVTILLQQNAVNVQWTDQIIRDGQLISEQPHRKAYQYGQMAEFLSEVEGAEHYIPVLGWDVPPADNPEQALKDVKAVKLAEINAACNREINAIRASYPETEVLSWPKQETEARALVEDELAETLLVDAIAAGRNMTRRDLAERIIEKADSFALVSGAAIGKRQALEDTVLSAETIEEVSTVAW